MRWMRMKKQWYEIIIVSTDDRYFETVARVRSKGLAYIVLKEVEKTYKDTIYVVNIK